MTKLPRYVPSGKVWFAIPVAQGCVEDASRTFEEWRSLGYNCLALVDGPEQPQRCVVLRRPLEYQGWAWATNLLAQSLKGHFSWLVAGGHDVLPHPDLSAQAIAAQCKEHFAGTMGVMQPCGDIYGALADKSACVSAWIGADFCAKYGPFHEGYFHFWADTELMHVAARDKCLWWRDDLTQFHDHHARKPRPAGQKWTHPKYLNKAAEMGKIDEALFLRRKAMGFP